ncbi:OmpA family protein [Actibacterium sp. 188UL27-1]|uniref:OmpA family protein n=1 Tax=Actibacterium sp. 188UL27-1 TaxID=2786961 RepID=UPI00195710D2|nr:OmpA family protein [Actibacterium sp. 188UL27-1]MBM7066066.1 OmpA family protein [Actibacterium sp. 188UL27-1]
MRLGPKILTISAFVLAALVAVGSAVLSAGLIERVSGSTVKTALLDAGHDWADVQTDGLEVILTGTAPSEALRLRAVAVTGSIVDATRVIDGMDVKAAEPLAPPRFSVELLRNDEGISLIGLVPAAFDRAEIIDPIQNLANGVRVTDLLETADYPEPDGWRKAVSFGLEALEDLPRSKISIAAGEVRVTAISRDGAEKSRLETRLARSAPRGLRLALNITAPRPVITPFTLRFTSDVGNGIAPRFDACSAESQVSRARILAAARKLGLEGKADCTLGLGVPTTEWSEAAEQAIAAVGELGGGSVTMSDVDITLVALPSTPQSNFDRVVGELESNLPEVFSLYSVLPEPVKVDGTGDQDSGPPEFVATRSPEGQVQLRGRLTDAKVREAVESFARARFGTKSVYAAARLDPELPEGWPIRVLAGLQALSELAHGSVVVQPDYLELRGTSGSKDASDTVSRLLSESLGDAQNFEIAVSYDEKLDPLAAIPTPKECLTRINQILTTSKITFEPGSADLAGPSQGIMDSVAEVFKTCRKVTMDIEIGGHTDSQGREEMNRSLSQQRADAVLNALIERRVLTGNITSRGYGETTPIADNDTEEGREANRRIEFRLIDAVQVIGPVQDPAEQPAASEDQEEDETASE